MTHDDKLRLLLYGPEVVNVQCLPIFGADYEELPELMEYMLKVMKRCSSFGIAAPQVGVFKNFFVCEFLEFGVMGLVNPEVTRMFGKEEKYPESCLSLPPVGNQCPVPRMEAVMVHAALVETPDVEKDFKFTGADARLVQRELDHLTGTFFIDRVGDKQKREVLEKYQHWKLQWEMAGRPFPY